MYNDILGIKKKGEEETQESIIESMKYNIKEKDKIIKDLIKQVTDLERQIESIENGGTIV